jgi:3-phenylpropionate/trans-cinnamate dioxygenase ferredoxin reductase subunit
MERLLSRSPVAVAVGWIGTYLAITLLPLLLLLIYPPSAGRGFWIDFSVALGFIALAMMALQFALTARIKAIESSYGIDIILQFHRYTSLIAFIMVLVHPGILFIVQPEMLQLLNLSVGPWRSRLAVLSTQAFIALVVTTIWRKQLKIPYEPWRASHSLLSMLALGLGFGHAVGVSHYLSLFWKTILWTAIISVSLWLMIYVRLVKPCLMTKKPYLVESITPERGNVWVLALRPQGHGGFCFQPGQFAWMTLNITPFSMREHPFSIASSSERPERLEFGIKAVGDFTSRIKDHLPGTKAYLDGPYGVFTSDRYQDSAGFVLIAGGIGITPMMSMLVTAAERGDKRPFLLIYASNSWEEITYRETLEELKSPLNLTIVHVLRKVSSDWQGETGYVDKTLLERYIPEHRGTRHYLICAASQMMDQVERALEELQVPITNIHLEHFNLA